MTSCTMTIVKLVTLILMIYVLISVCSGQYNRCGGRLTQKQGVIQSPNYPGPFETPVFCEWVIQAPPKLKIVLYLTQYYLKGFFHVYEFDHYTNKDEWIGERKLATVNCEDEIWSIVAHKPFMVLRFAVQEMGNIHLRVLDHLIDVYGFNITYEMVSKHEVDSKWTCSAFDCSYLGNCYASADYSEYKCHCFPNFSGEECQYGPHCNPMIEKNMCQNNGSCRYLYGDYVNICQCVPGYLGSMCEQKINGIHPSACAVLDCEQTCITSKISTASCGCNHGFRLNRDKRTCVHIDRHKYDIRCDLQNSSTLLTSGERNAIQQKINIMLQQRGVFSVENVTIRQDSEDYIDIRLYIESIERSILDSNLPEVLRRLEGVNLDMETLQITSVPDRLEKLYLLSVTMRVDTGSGLAALEDKSMTLSCVARGRPSITFKWFKDGYLLDLRFDVSLFRKRAQETLIPASRDGILRSVITFDHVSPLDRGTFTCEARDGEKAENKSISVNVLTVPLVDLYPLSISVVEGESMSIICMSPEDTAKNFTYTWHSGRTYIPPGQPDQIVEDLFPTGTRLFVRKINKSANFSCTVENKAGAFTLTSHVFVQKASAANMTCGKSYHKQVMWTKTAGNHFDKERCPSETGDFSVYGPINNGYATRQCVCSGETCTWAEPNYAKCQSVYLVYEVYDKLEMLRLGYQQTTIKYVYDRLCEFIIKRNNNHLYSGDVELAVSILHELLRHLEQYPQLSARDDKITLKSLIDLMNVMLFAANQSTWEEKQDMKAAPYFLKINQIISRSISSVLYMEPDSKYTSESIDVKTDLLPVQIDTGNNSNTSIADSAESGEPEYLTDMEKLQVLSFKNKAIVSMLSAKEQNPSIKFLSPISDVHSIFLMQGSSLHPENLIAYIPIKHTTQSSTNKYNQTVCVSWEFDQREPQFGRWTKNQCTVSRTDESQTVCKCSLPGHFMVVSISTNIKIPKVVTEPNPALPIIIACIINIVVLGIGVFIYILKRKWLVGDEYPIHFSFMVSILLQSITFLVCLKNVHNTALCSVGRIVVYFCFLAAFSCLFAESMHIYISTARKQQISKQWYKYLLIGWVIPVILAIFFGVASKIFPANDNSLLVCWIEGDQWHFYGFIIPIVALDIAILFMLIFALHSCIRHQDEARYTSKRTFCVTCLKSISILLLLNVVSYLSTGIGRGDHDGYVISYSILVILLVMVIFISRCVIDKEIMTILWRRLSPFKNKPPMQQMNRNQSSSSFKGYMKPELPEQFIPERHESNMHYDQVNRMKFTHERKRQLSDLLGSSQTGVNLVAYNQDRRSNRSLPQDNGAADSGIFGSETERFLNSDLEQFSQRSSFSKIAITVADVHSPILQNGSFMTESLEPFPELIQRRACKDVFIQSSTPSNGIVRPKYSYYIDPKANKVISESGESTTLLIQEKKPDDKSEENESDSV
ncbi:uncharacterized protein [Mytilus edulis]|uniref:uncharacterized protein isoform X3 n=1 Tax=Mytilus edulis TaxID=6550 RepID=UPI0039EE3B93